MRTVRILPEGRNTKCSFERIYFSRGSDFDIYKERKNLGRRLVPAVLEAVGDDLDNTVFSFIPNTAEVAFYGMVEGLDEHLKDSMAREISALSASGTLDETTLHRILTRKVRIEKVAIKDIKLRTFIAEGTTRNDLAAHVYDITYGSINPGDNLVVIDDSIVRGTTLRQSIIRILDRLNPRKLVVVSSSPQVRFPDCYGIDMSRMAEFIAFKAAMALLEERGLAHIADSVYEACRNQDSVPDEQIRNYVTDIYRPFSDKEVSAKIAELLTPEGTKAQVEIVYQSVDNLREAIPDHRGDWYFTGDYPTVGGIRLVNKAFVNFYEGRTLARD